MGASFKYVVEPAREGMRGFDINQKLTLELCKAFVEHKYDFAVRYVRRASAHSYDLTFEEVTGILASGLGLMIVQHVAPDGWLPSGYLGQMQARTAVQEVAMLQLPENTMLWCDLEGVGAKASTFDIIAFCNAWYDVVKAARLTPGLYVGSGCGLSSQALYRELRFNRYWAAYNLNADEIPATRGVCMYQRVARPADRVPGIQQDGFDVDLVVRDQVGDLPLLLRAVPG